ncbi:uncharacterized protein CANTADRAFT_48192 [Suhomyces tanzawaensis NRRL Y-17324]|uniref:HIG1 domain-containing protein n=1 Tax=Suhomyces tanzawaensis NRRL Y-17324 TaxID=984487 RepID=A0A1E4SNM2_9ASCO|nr:uncharacterized protein CANTADRAFT_48192 [Suhomyces tanzawaensis NRRL Y-17324]ODV80982.1 hypothetical protein CANTADRAFT_48192 [Suhomyces tanzawaensis NRRL Y-17324]
MKILDKEERQAHISHITTEGFKGLVYGSILSTGLFAYLKKRHAGFNRFSTSIKTCIIVMPTISLGAFFADQGSWEFDKQMHSSAYTQGKLLEEYREWNNLSMSDKIFTTLNQYKYEVIITSWVGSLYGSWVYVNRDKIMTTSQKAVQARMYAQAITIVLLLGTILLAMKEQEINKSKPAPLPAWKQVLLDKEAEEKRLLESHKARGSKAESEENSK